MNLLRSSSNSQVCRVGKSFIYWVPNGLVVFIHIQMYICTYIYLYIYIHLIIRLISYHLEFAMIHCHNKRSESSKQLDTLARYDQCCHDLESHNFKRLILQFPNKGVLQSCSNIDGETLHIDLYSLIQDR